MGRLSNHSGASKQELRPQDPGGGRSEVPDERRLVVIEGVSPEIDCGRFSVKRVIGDEVVVEVDAFADGHELLHCSLLHRKGRERSWRSEPMKPLGNDRWRGSFTVSSIGRHDYTILAGIDPFETWRRDLGKRITAAQHVSVDLLIGAEIVEREAVRVSRTGRSAGDRRALDGWIERLRSAAEIGAPPAALS